MIKLDNYLEGISKLPTLASFAGKLEARLSFLGGRYIAIKQSEQNKLDCRGTLPLNAIFNKALNIIIKSGRTCDANNKLITEKEHWACRKLEKIISDFYDQNEFNIKNANIITRIFVFIRHFFAKDYKTDWNTNFNAQILKREANLFYSKTDKKYVKKTDKDRASWHEPRHSSKRSERKVESA